MLKALKIVALMAALFAVGVAGCSKEEGDQSAAGQGQAGQAQGQMAGSLDPSDQTVAITVNGEEITNGQIAEEVARLSRQFGGRMSPEQMAQMQDALVQQARDNLISRILLEQKIKEDGIQVAPEEIAERMDEVRASVGSEGYASRRRWRTPMRKPRSRSRSTPQGPRTRRNCCAIRKPARDGTTPAAG